MRKLTALSLLILSFAPSVLTSCGKKEKYNLKKLSDEVGSKLIELNGKEENHLKSLISALYPQKWKIIKIFGVKGNVSDFKRYLVAVYNPYQHAVFYNFVWITKDGRYLTTNLYKVENNTLSLIVPKKTVDYPLEDISWILNINRIIYAQNLPLQLTNGKNVVYLVWNPYCVKCFERWSEIVQQAKRNNLSIVLLPYHNIYYPQDNIYMLLYLLWKAQNQGLYSVLNEYYSNSKSFEDFIKKLKEDTYKGLAKIPKQEFNNLGYSIENISKILNNAKIYTVPTTIVVKDIDKINSLASGYIYVNKINLNVGK